MRVQYLIIYFSIFICGCRSVQNTDSDPIPVHDSLTISSNLLNENRVINIWLPEIYKQSTDSLTVLYMADGGVKEDFPHIANTLEKLINEGKIKPIILVGIENTVRRRDLTPITEIDKDKEVAPVVGGSEKFRAFIKQELIPEIDKRYRTRAERGIIGESLAGLFVMETFFTEPTLFTHYIAFDPSLWWNNHFLNRNATSLSDLADSTDLWFAGSSAEDISIHTNELAQILKANTVKKLKWHYSDEPKEKHNTIFRATKEKALLWTFGLAD